MIAVAFLTFALLIVAWLMASNGEVKAAVPKTASTTLQLGDSRA